MERKTHQKEIVMSTVFRLQGQHPTADTVYENVKYLIPTIGRATVYRLLNRLCAQGIINRISIPSSADRYDTFLDSHYHLRCNSCGKVLDIDIPVIEDLCDRVPESDKYKITGHNVVFIGLCSKCEKVK